MGSKFDDFDEDDPLAGLLSDDDDNTRPKSVKNHPAPKEPELPKPEETPKDKSKLMKELFGLEKPKEVQTPAAPKASLTPAPAPTSVLAPTLAPTTPAPSAPETPKTTPAVGTPPTAPPRKSRNISFEVDDDDEDLFAGLAGSKKPGRTTTSRDSKDDFMSSLFGGGGAHQKKSFESSSDFVLDEKYKKKDPVSTPRSAEPKAPAEDLGSFGSIGGRRRRGGPTLTSDPPMPAKNIDELFENLEQNKQAQEHQQPKPMAVSTTNHAPNWLYSNHSMSAPQGPPPPIGVSKEIVDMGQRAIEEQMMKMSEFERQEQERFKGELEAQRRAMEAKQQEYRTAMLQQKMLADEQVRALSEKQAEILKRQQEQFAIIMKQVQAQTEMEMKMKSDLLRNQIAIASEFQNVEAEAILKQIKQPDSENKEQQGKK